jgi:predicted dehydrogenase
LGNIKILLVGCGYWGKNWYNTIKNSSCELVGVVDPNPILDVDVPLFDNINSVNVDYSHIILSVPPKHVNKIFKDIKIESSKILIEKPCGVSKKDVKKLGEFYPGFIFLNSPHYQYIKKNINKIGKPLFFNSSRASMGPRIRTDVSILEDYLIHDLYIFMGLFGKEISIENVFMSNTFNNPIKSDTINLNLKCGNIRADMFSSWWFPQKTRKLFIIGDKGSFIWEDESLRFYNGYYKEIDGMDKNRNDGYELIDSLTEPLIYTSQKSNLELELDNFINNKKLDVTALDVWDLIERIKNES